MYELVCVINRNISFVFIFLFFISCLHQ